MSNSGTPGKDDEPDEIPPPSRTGSGTTTKSRLKSIAPPILLSSPGISEVFNRPEPQIGDVDLEGHFEFDKDTKVIIKSEDLIQLDIVGKGQYATVYKMKYKPTGNILAVKKMTLSVDFPDSVKSTALEDAKVLRKTKLCPYVIDFYGTLLHEGQIYLGEELMDASLDIVLKNVYSLNQQFSECALKKIAFSVVSALKFLLDISYMHRDIKPSNLLINTKGEVKLCDMGIAGYLIDNRANTNVGTTAYLAPERITNIGKYHYVCDVWSFGITMIELASGAQPYFKQGAKVFDIMLAITRSPPPDPPADRSQSFQRLCKECLVQDPNKRPNYENLLAHEFLFDALSDPFDMAVWYQSIRDLLESKS